MEIASLIGALFLVAILFALGILSFLLGILIFVGVD